MVWVPCAVVLGFILVIGLLAWWRIAPMVGSAKAVMQQVEVLKAAAKEQDMAKLSAGLPELQTRLDTLQGQVEWFGFARHWPVVGTYYQDSEALFAGAKEGITGGQILVKGVEPYAEVLGFKGAAPATEKPTEDRIAELTLLMPSLLPSLDESQEHFEKLKQHFDQVDVTDYPGKIGDTDVRQTLTDVKNGVNGLESGIHQIRPLLTILPSMLGAPDPKKYLILFQNDKELRPTGGFITSVAYVSFNQGKFTVSDTGDIYTIDDNSTYLPMPDPIRAYLKVPGWHLRDTNFSPDFAESMETFRYYYDRIGDPAIDGIIALDTQFVEALMRITGPLEVPGYSKPFSAEPITVNGTKVPQVVYQLEIISEKIGGEDRKGILGDLMQVMIKKVLSEPATKWPEYLAMFMTQGQEKNILFNFEDIRAQEYVEDQNLAGRIEAVQPPGDYLHINDANLAGLKSNFYLTQEAKQEVTIAGDGTVKEKVTITYRNTGKFDGWLNATARNYVRVYVPEGAELLDASGGDARVEVENDLGKTVFDNFVTIKPMQSRTLTFEYKLPFKITGDYHGLIQKQPGANNWDYTVTVNGKSQDILLDGDKEIAVKK